MNAHTPFDAKQDWTNPYCQNSSNDPMVDALLGNAYHVVRTVYCNLGNLKLIYDFLNQYGMVLGVQSEAELKALTTKATFARIYDKTPAGDRQVTDYLYVEGDRTGILPDDTTATGSWVKVATSGSSESGESTNDGGYIPWIYNSGSANGGETTIHIPDETAGAPFMIVNGDWQTEGYDFEYDPVAFEVSFTTPLEPGDFVVVMRTGVPATPDNPNVSDWVTINWLYNQGAAVGGEQVINIPYTFQSVPAVYRNGLRLYKELTNNSYTIDSDNNRIILTEPLATNDRLIVQLGGEAKVLEIADHTIQEVARASNAKDSEVILSTDTTQVLNGKKIVYDVVAQKIYGIPVLPPNVYISSVSNGQLTYSPGSVTVNLIPVPESGNELKQLLLSNAGAGNVFTSSGLSVQESLKQLKNVPISPEMFGADPTGVEESSDAFIAAEAAAYAINGSLVATGKYLMSKGFTCRVPFDFSKATFHVSSTWDGAINRFLIHLTHPSNKTEVLTVTVASNGVTIPALSGYTNHCVHVQSQSEVGYQRTGSNILKQEVYHIINGTVQGFKSNIDINSVCTVKSSSLDVDPITVHLPTVVFDAVPTTPLNHVFRIERAFVDVIGGSYNTHDQSVSANRQAFNAFVNLMSTCYRVRVIGTKGYGFFKNTSDGFSYTVNLSGLYPSAIDCSDPENWGLVDGTLMKGALIKRCHGARMGTHEDVTDLTIEDCTAYTRGFMLGSGYGTLVMRNPVFYMTTAQNMLEFRYDYGNCWKGDIVIDSPTIHLSAGIPAFTALVKFQVALNTGIYLSSNVTAYTCNTLTVSNLSIHSSTEQTNAYEVWNVASDFSQPVKMPTRVVIDGISTFSELPSYIKVGTSGAYLSGNARMIASTTEVVVSNFTVNSPATNFQITPRIADVDKAGMRNSYRWIFKNVKGLAINTSLPSGNTIEIDSCSVYRLDNSSISGMTDQTRIKVRNSTFTDTLQCRTNGGQIELDSVSFTSVGAVGLGGIVKSTGTTILAGSTITGQTSLSAALLMSYKDSALFA